MPVVSIHLLCHLNMTQLKGAWRDRNAMHANYEPKFFSLCKTHAYL